LTIIRVSCEQRLFTLPLSVQFAQFLAKLAETVIPLVVTVHFFSALGSEQPGRTFQPFGLLVKQVAHFSGYRSYPIVVHSRSMQLFTARISSIVNTNAEET
jgi:hypothetical protein